MSGPRAGQGHNQDQRHARAQGITGQGACQYDGHARAIEGGANLRVQGSIYFIEEIEGCWVTSLDGKDEGQGHYSLLPSRQLLHCHGLTAAKGHLQDTATDEPFNQP